MPVLGCGAEMAKLMDVSDQDVATIEEVIAERLSLGVSQAVAQRQAVDEALAQLAEERTMVMRAIDEQLGKAPANEPVAEPAAPVFANREQTDTTVDKARIEQEAYDMIEADPEGMVDAYLEKNGNVIDPDLVKLMFPAFVADPSLAAAVHEPSSKLAKLIYTEALKRNAGKEVVFTAGGGGSGKSAAMPAARSVADIEGDPLTYDSTLSSYSSAIQRIDQALASKAPVTIVYTNTPVEKAFEFASKRTRVVPVHALAAAHTGASNTIRRLAAHYADNPNVRIVVINNTGELGGISVGEVDDVPKYEQNDVERSLYELASQARDSGQIPNDRYAALVEGRSERSPGSSDRTVQEGQRRQELGGSDGRDRGQEDAGRQGAGRGLRQDEGSTGSEQRDGLTLFANKPTSKWIGEDGRWQFAPGQMLVDLMGKKAGPLLDRLYLRSASPEVRHALRKMKLDVQKAMDTTHELVGAMREMSAEERSMISDIIEKEVKAGVTPPASAVQHAAMMNEAFETQTNELVRLGMLTQEAADRWRGKYLPRYYESRLSGSVSGAWADLVKFIPRNDSLKGIKGKHLRGRGMTQAISTSELADYQAKGWEVRDKDFDPAKHDTVYVWRDFTKEEREKMGEIRDAGFRFTMGYMQTQKDIALGRMYESIASNPDMASRTQPDDTYVQVPDTNVPDTGAKRYGNLAGMWVSRNLMAQLSSQMEMESDALRLYRQALSIWKENKTVLNPVSHMNNFVSNLTMAHLAGVSYWDAHKYAGAIRDFAKGGGMIKEAHEAGLFLGSMSEEELGKMLPMELQSLINKQDSKTITGMKLAHTVLTWGLRRPAGIAYEFGDRFFKYLIYKDARAQGMTPDEAVDYAQKYIFTYDGLPRTARAIRDLAIPFFSYTYKAIPTLAEAALTHPHRMLAPAALLHVAGLAAYSMAAGGGDDDWMDAVKKYLTDEEFRKKADTLQEEEYKLLPEWMKGRTALGSQKTLRLGTDELTGNPVFLDASRFIPGGDLFDVTGNAGGIPWVQPLTPSNPLLSLYTAMIANKDVFTGKELVSKDLDTAGEAFDKRADWLWKLAAPAIAINQAHWDRAVNAVAHMNGDEELPIPDLIGGKLTGIGKDGMPVQAKYAAMNTVGIKARPLDLDMSEQIQDSQKRKTLRDLEAQLRQARMLNQKGAMGDREFERKTDAINLKKERIRDSLTVDGNARP